MLHDHKERLTKDEQNAVGVFMTSLKLCGHRCIPPNAPHKQDLLKAIKEVNAIKMLFELLPLKLSQFLGGRSNGVFYFWCNICAGKTKV